MSLTEAVVDLHLVDLLLVHVLGHVLLLHHDYALLFPLYHHGEFLAIVSVIETAIRTLCLSISVMGPNASANV